MSIDLSQIKTGERVRVTFEGKLTALPLGPSAFGPIPLLNAEGKHAATLERPVLVSVEDAPLALPTEPGTRFWGRSQQIPREQWWFVQANPDWASDKDAGFIVYVPSMDGHVYSGACVNGLNAEREGITRLPDPEETP